MGAVRGVVASIFGSPAIAATLSFLLPGLGQISSGAFRRGALFAIPIVFAIAGFVAGVRATTIDELVDIALQPETLVVLLAANVIVGAWHVLSVVDAWRLAARRSTRTRHRRLGGAVLVAVIVATLALHGAIELVGYEAYDTLDTVFVPTDGDDGWAIPEPSGLDDLGAAIDDNEDDVDATDPLDLPPPALYPASELLDPTPTPSPTPKPKPVTARWAADGRLNMLLIGSDAGPDRWMLRTDTMIVLSIDNKTGRAALFGVPRNLVGVPLPPESARAFKYGRFPGLLNALYVYAMKHPDRFPGGDARGFRAVTGAVQELVGVRLDSVVVVNLAGFVKLVNALGGLWIRVEERVVDSFYPLEDGSGHIRIDIRAGCQRLSGRMALAYARSRHQDSDYGRMERQQAVLVALARQVDAIRIVPRVRALLSIAKGNLWMTVKRADIGGLARLAERVDPLRVKRILFVPPAFASHLTTPEINRIRAVVHSALRTPGPAPREWYARPCP